MGIKEIAKLSNVSPSTVSRVLNNYKWVSPEIREKVLSVIEKENYVPNYHAGAMAVGKSKMVLIVIPSINSPYFSEFASVVMQKLIEAGYLSLIFETRNDEEREKAFFKSTFAQVADAVISVTDGVANRDLHDMLKPFLEKEKPIIFVDRRVRINGVECVTYDNYHAIKNAYDCLYNKGHRRIGIMLGSSGYSVVEDKLRGYYAALESHNLQVDSSLIFRSKWDFDSGVKVMNKLLFMENRATGVIICNDLLCEGAVFEAERQGFTIGRDISIIGTEESNRDQRIFSWMGITTLNLRCQEVSEYTVNRILDKLGVQETNQTQLCNEFEIELVQRKSIAELITK